MSDRDDAVEAELRKLWFAMRDNASSTTAGKVMACILFAWRIGCLTSDQRELWQRRITTCPGHDDEGGRVWCAYCGDMPKGPG